jgi:hypothetical protein
VPTAQPGPRRALAAWVRHGSRRKFTHQPLPRRLSHGFLPIYLVQTVDGELLAHCNASDKGDAFLEACCPRAPALAILIEAEPETGPRQVWTKWISEQDRGRATLGQLPSGILQTIFGPDAFSEYPKLALTRLGSYLMRSHHFLQLWCEDGAPRRRVPLDRVVGLATPPGAPTQQELWRRLAAISEQLEVRVPRLDNVLRHAERGRRVDRAARLEGLPLGQDL